MPAIQKGASPPDLLGETLDGHEIRLSDLSGKIVVLIFWKTWCNACKQELIETKALVHAYQNKFIIYAINIGEPPDVVRKFQRLYRLNYPVLVDRQATIISSYGIKAWPTTILINRQGRVHWTSIGSEVENMRQEIEVLLRE